MKKFFTILLLLFIFLTTQSFSQASFEDFDYPTGDSLGAHGWEWHSGSGNTLLVTSGSLSYPGYYLGVGNSTTVFGGSGSREDSHKYFTPVDTVGSYYAAFLVKVDTAVATGDYFIHFSNNPHTTSFRGRLFVKADGLGGFQFGISKATSTVTYTTASYVFHQTYLIVLKYEYIGSMASDDVVSIYVNPDPTQPEPALADAVNSDSGTDIILGAMDLRQGSNVYTVQVDGINLSNTWETSVPVELTSFLANVDRNIVNLNWETATETNNHGFQVERKTANSTWQTIGFVNGNGTTTEMQSYSYSDKNLLTGNYSYRLKQIDFNGNFEYSNIIEAEVVAVNKFELAQNYPNPFNPSTKITFSIPQAGNVKLSVYNLLGQDVKTLVNGFTSEGTHTVNFDASNLNSGVYIYKIEANNFTQTRKMTLIK